MTHALKFISLRFSDFKTFSGKHKVKLNQPAGLYFFTGKNKLHPQLGANGCGKSTIFDALFWCFWGKTIKDSRPANAVVPWDAAKSSPRAEVRFDRDEKQWTLIRSRKPNSLRLVGNTDKEVIDREITQDDVPGILGMNEETFRRTILIGQFGTMFLDLKPEAQSAMFSEALDLDRWLGLSKLAGQTAAKWEGTIDLAKGDVSTLTGKLEATRTARADAKVAVEEWDALHAERVDLYVNTVARHQATVEKLAAQPHARSGKASKLRADREAAKEALAGADAAVKAALKGLGGAQSSLAVSVAAQRAARAKQVQLQDGATDKTCPACGQKVSGKHLASELKGAELLAVQLAKLFDAAKADVAENETAVTKAEKKKASAEQVVEDLGDQIAEAEKNYNEWCGKHDAAVTELDNAKTALSKLKKEVNPHSDTVDRLLVRIKDIKKELEKTTASLAEAEKAAGQYKYWVTAFKEIRLSLIDEVLAELEITSTAHAERLGLVGWEVKFQTERETKTGDVSYGFTVLLFPPGQKTPVRWESYSGGEDRRWQLAVTFGLSEVLLARAGLTSNLEVLDEPAQHMSAEGVESLLESLSDRAKEQGKSILYCDHTSLDRGNFDGVFTVVHDKEGSRVTQ